MCPNVPNVPIVVKNMCSNVPIVVQKKAVERSEIPIICCRAIYSVVIAK
jgi:hypothetical protein